MESNCEVSTYNFLDIMLFHMCIFSELHREFSICKLYITASIGQFGEAQRFSSHGKSLWLISFWDGGIELFGLTLYERTKSRSEGWAHWQESSLETERFEWRLYCSTPPQSTSYVLYKKPSPFNWWIDGSTDMETWGRGTADAMQGCGRLGHWKPLWLLF